MKKDDKRQTIGEQSLPGRLFHKAKSKEALLSRVQRNNKFIN